MEERQTETAQTNELTHLHGSYQLDPSRSRIELHVPFLTFLRTQCTFDLLDGSIDLTAKTLSVRATIDAASFHSNNPKRDEHVRSADILDTDRHPAFTVTVDSNLDGVAADAPHAQSGVVAASVQRGDRSAAAELSINNVQVSDGLLTATVTGTVDRTALGAANMPRILIGHRIPVTATITARRD